MIHVPSFLPDATCCEECKEISAILENGGSTKEWIFHLINFKLNFWFKKSQLYKNLFSESTRQKGAWFLAFIFFVYFFSFSLRRRCLIFPISFSYFPFIWCQKVLFILEEKCFGKKYFWKMQIFSVCFIILYTCEAFWFYIQKFSQVA